MHIRLLPYPRMLLTQNCKFFPYSMKSSFVILCLVLLSGCATYYHLNQDFNRNFENGDLPQAEKLLTDNKGAAEGRERFLYFLNRGSVAALLDKPKESNDYLERAYLFGEDYQTNYIREIGSLFTNPNLVTYKGEDHEHLMLLYYKALNYLKLGDTESALVECRRLNDRLDKLSDKYRSDNRYKKDAFVHTLMGIIYDADKDYNNAFIAYRNAYNIYKSEYVDFFGVNPPEQLQDDLLRTAYLNGFLTDLEEYEREFKKKYRPSAPEGGELVFFWNNGLGPIKSEWSVNFSIIKGSGGNVTFVNEEYGLNFPFLLDSDESSGSLNDLRFFRVAFPKYVEREPLYTAGNLLADGKTYKLELAEDLNKIAFKTLAERMHIEMGKSLLRAALKKATEQGMRKENEGLATILGMVNAATEKADTRNWQTIPHSIYYTRIQLPEGVNEVKLKTKAKGNSEYNQVHDFVFDIRKNQTQFHAFFSLEMAPQFVRGQQHAIAP